MKRILLAASAALVSAPAFALTTTDPTIVALNDAFTTAPIKEWIGVGGAAVIGLALAVKAVRYAKRFVNMS